MTDKTDQDKLREAKVYQATVFGRYVSRTLKRLPEMEIDEYVEAIRAVFVSPDATENFMRILTSCTDEAVSTIVVHGKRHRVIPRKSTIFKKTFAEFLIREAKLNFTAHLNDPVSYLAYANALAEADERPRRRFDESL